MKLRKHKDTYLLPPFSRIEQVGLSERGFHYAMMRVGEATMGEMKKVGGVGRPCYYTILGKKIVIQPMPARGGADLVVYYSPPIKIA